jgi:hypothetical protein
MTVQEHSAAGTVGTGSSVTKDSPSGAGSALSTSGLARTASAVATSGSAGPGTVRSPRGAVRPLALVSNRPDERHLHLSASLRAIRDDGPAAAPMGEVLPQAQVATKVRKTLVQGKQVALVGQGSAGATAASGRRLAAWLQLHPLRQHLPVLCVLLVLGGTGYYLWQQQQRIEVLESRLLMLERR